MQVYGKRGELLLVDAGPLQREHRHHAGPDIVALDAARRPLWLRQADRASFAADIALLQRLGDGPWPRVAATGHDEQGAWAALDCGVGPSLSAVLAAAGPEGMGLDAALVLAHDVARTVTAAADAQIEAFPTNVLVDADGGVLCTGINRATPGEIVAPNGEWLLELAGLAYEDWLYDEDDGMGAEPDPDLDPAMASIVRTIGAGSWEGLAERIAAAHDLPGARRQLGDLVRAVLPERCRAVAEWLEEAQALDFEAKLASAEAYLWPDDWPERT